MTFLEHSRYLLATEYRTKLRRALDALPPHALWRRPGADANSVGNLLLHLNGNVRQWILGGVAGREIARERAAEFAARDGADAQTLFAALSSTIDEVDSVLAALTPEELEQRRLIQGRDVTVLQAVYHVVEHFAMHTGQILLLVKLHAPGSLGFYEDAGGLARPRWSEDASR